MLAKNLAITADYASASVREKVEKAGGKLTVLHANVDDEHEKSAAEEKEESKEE